MRFDKIQPSDEMTIAINTLSFWEIRHFVLPNRFETCKAEGQTAELPSFNIADLAVPLTFNCVLRFRTHKLTRNNTKRTPTGWEFLKNNWTLMSWYLWWLRLESWSFVMSMLLSGSFSVHTRMDANPGRAVSKLKKRLRTSAWSCWATWRGWFCSRRYLQPIGLKDHGRDKHAIFLSCSLLICICF